MPGSIVKWLIGLVVVAALAWGVIVAFGEKPVLVDTALAERGPLTVTVNEEGIAQVRDVYTVSAPMAGHLNRITLDEGDTVDANSSVVATMHPMDPPFLDARTRTELVAAIEAARSAIALAEVERERAEAALTLAQSAFDRAFRLAKTRVVSESQLEQTETELKLQKAQLASAEANIRLRHAELAAVEAKLTQPGDVSASPADEDCCVNITAPVDGVILRILARSEQAVTAGMKIAEIGNPQALEIVVDLLSSDAVRISTGSRAVISDWGGPGELTATVRRIDPAAFTKISALGIEEQRVNVVLDLDDVPPGLGHGFRVFARLAVWSGDDVLQVPLGAMFRANGAWAVFVVEEDRAVVREVETGHLTDRFVEITSGLDGGETVILYPNDLLADGRLVEKREQAQ